MNNYGIEIALPTAHRANPNKRFYSYKRGEAMVAIPHSSKMAIIKGRRPSYLHSVKITASHAVSVALVNAEGIAVWKANANKGVSIYAVTEHAVPLAPNESIVTNNYIWKITHLKGKGSVIVESTAKYLVYDTEDQTHSRK